MRSILKRTLAAVLCVLMTLSLFTSVGAAPAMRGEDYTVAEVPPEVTSGDVGPMPNVDHSHAVVDTPAVTEREEPATLAAADPAYVHNFTTDGKTEGGIYTAISGNTSTSKGTVTYNGLTLTQCLKMESSTTITVKAPENGTLTLVFKEGGKTFKLDGTAVTTESDGTAAVSLSTGTHTVTKGDSINLFYLEFKTAGCETHTWGTAYSQVKAPTCTEAGTEANTCTVCGAVNADTRSVPALGHEFKSYAVTQAAKCNQKGSETAKCTRCDVTDTREIDYAEHTFPSGAANCTVCGVLKGKEPCQTHSFGAASTTPATCTAAGKTEQTCTECGMTVVENLPALGHNWGTWTETPGTCQTPGTKSRECSRCHEKESESTGLGEHKFSGSTCTVCGATAGITAGGWFETLYAEIDGISDSQVTGVSYSGPMSGALSGEDLQYLVRDAKLASGKTGVRIDIPGLTAGTYSLTVTAGGKFVATGIEVMAHDRSGYAHFNYAEGVGAYRDDGVLKEDAIVLYVTEQNKNTVTLTAPDGTTVTGIGHILNTAGSTPKSGGKANNNQGILKKLADANVPLVVRIIGQVTDPDGTTVFDSVDYGGTVGDQGGMVRMKSAKNITVEGIGADATMYGWGVHFMAGSDDPAAGRGKGFEVRNITFKEVPEDCVGLEGNDDGGWYPVERGWVHNCAFYPAHIANPAESDKADGDGSCDFKRGQYFTMSYCYFEGCHKTNLVGASDKNEQYHITWHHNWWKDCKARGPLGRQANMHIYNCIYEGQTDYAMNPRANCYIYSEYNTFLNCKNPVQVTSGAVKSYHDAFSSCIEANDATIVTNRTQKVSSSNKYASFELDASISYIPSGNYKLDTDLATAQANIKAYTGPMKAVVVKAEETDTGVVEEDRTPTAPVKLPYEKELNSTYVTSASKTVDNVIFNVTAVKANLLEMGGTGSTGQNIVFMIDQYADITMTPSGSSLISLVDENGTTVTTNSTTAVNCPPGIYFIQPSTYQPAKGTTPGYFKSAKISGLKIVPTTATTKPHEHSFGAYTQTVAPTCTKEGVEKATCSCGEVVTRPVAKIAHNYANGFCLACGVADGTFNDGSNTGETIPVQSVTISQTTLELEQSSRVQLTATVVPSNATARKISWTSSNTAVATVSNTGMVMGQGAGDAVITASTADGPKASCTVHVIGVTTTGYTFNSAKYTPKDYDVVTAGTKLGDKDYFFVTGTGTQWRTNNTQSLLLGSKGSSGLSFTVNDGATAKVTMSVCSTGKSNASAVALLDANGGQVTAADGKMAREVSGTGGTTITFESLPAGTYTIVSPTMSANTDSRGVRIINATVTETKRSDGTTSVPVTAVTLDKTAVSLEKGGSAKLTATVAPDNASNKTVTWTTSNSAVVTVNGGTLYAVDAGIATVTASCGGKSASATITVTTPTSSVVAVTGVTLNKTTAELKVGATVALSATVAPDNATDKTVTWTTSSAAVATVAGGTVTARSAGTATITATAGGHSATCAVTVTVEEVPEEHIFRWVQTKAPTCKEKGQESYTCAKCGTVSEVRDVDMLPHTWGDWVTVKPATCTEDGEQERTCSVCKDKETDVLESPDGHDFGAWQVTKEATCQEEGMRVRYCAVCHTADSENIGMKPHDFGAWQTIVEPTCTEEGQKAQTCSVGGERVTESVDALGHDFVNGKCVRCQMSENLGDDEHIHDWGNSWSATTPATCTTAGVETRTCVTAGCGATEHREVAALGHDFGAWTVKTPATCTEKGEETRACSRCSETERREVAATGHTYGADLKCTVCGADQPVITIAVKGVVISPTSRTINVKDATTLLINVLPGNATNKTVRWTSSDETVATVKDGVVTGVKAGTATITVTTEDGGFTAECAITVKATTTTTSSGGGHGGGGGGGGGGGTTGGTTTTTPTTPDTSTDPVPATGLPFVDVAANAWYVDSVKKIYEMGLMKGTDDTHFTPSQNTSRAMVATVLYRLDGEKDVDVGDLFGDVASGAWYEKAVEWAADKGVVKGYSDNVFAPDDNVTREQLVVMLYRYAAPTILDKSDALGSFSDVGAVSDWAAEAMQWAVKSGIITGKGDGVLDPQGLATRAEICAMLVRFVELDK